MCKGTIMKNKKLFYIVGLIAVLGLVVGLPFAFDNKLLVNTQDVFQFYLLGKIGYGLILIAVVVLGLVKQIENKTYYPILGYTLFLQFVPLILRAYLNINDFQSGACLITLLVTVMIFLVIGVIVPGIKGHLKEVRK